MRMYIVNYGTSPHYEFDKGDKYYCKSLTSVKRVVKREMELEGYTNKSIKDILKPLVIYMMDKKTMMYPGQAPNLQFSNNDYELFIGIIEECLE